MNTLNPTILHSRMFQFLKWIVLKHDNNPTKLVIVPTAGHVQNSTSVTWDLISRILIKKIFLYKLLWSIEHVNKLCHICHKMWYVIMKYISSWHPIVVFTYHGIFVHCFSSSRFLSLQRSWQHHNSPVFIRFRCVWRKTLQDQSVSFRNTFHNKS